MTPGSRGAASVLGPGPASAEGDLSAASDVVLHILLLRRSRPALAEVYRRHGGAVYGAFRGLLGGEGEAEDRTCEFFVQLWHDPGAFDPLRGSLRSFLVAGVRRPRPGIAPEDKASVPSLAHRPPTFGALATTDRATYFSLEGVPVAEALAFDLVYFGRRSCAQVAGMLNEPEERVRQRVRVVLSRLAVATRDPGVTPAAAASTVTASGPAPDPSDDLPQLDTTAAKHSPPGSKRTPRPTTATP